MEAKTSLYMAREVIVSRGSWELLEIQDAENSPCYVFRYLEIAGKQENLAQRI